MSGYSGARYKSFWSEREAEDYLDEQGGSAHTELGAAYLKIKSTLTYCMVRTILFSTAPSIYLVDFSRSVDVMIVCAGVECTNVHLGFYT